MSRLKCLQSERGNDTSVSLKAPWEQVSTQCHHLTPTTFLARFCELPHHAFEPRTKRHKGRIINHHGNLEMFKNEMCEEKNTDGIGVQCSFCFYITITLLQEEQIVQAQTSLKDASIWSWNNVVNLPTMAASPVFTAAKPVPLTIVCALRKD